MAKNRRNKKPKLRKKSFLLTFSFPPFQPPLWQLSPSHLSRRCYHQPLAGLPYNTKNVASLSSPPARQATHFLLFPKTFPRPLYVEGKLINMVAGLGPVTIWTVGWTRFGLAHVAKTGPAHPKKKRRMVCWAAYRPIPTRSGWTYFGPT
jgi:hypothetical protein